MASKNKARQNYLKPMPTEDGKNGCTIKLGSEIEKLVAYKKTKSAEPDFKYLIYVPKVEGTETLFEGKPALAAIHSEEYRRLRDLARMLDGQVKQLHNAQSSKDEKKINAAKEVLLDFLRNRGYVKKPDASTLKTRQDLQIILSDKQQELLKIYNRKNMPGGYTTLTTQAFKFAMAKTVQEFKANWEKAKKDAKELVNGPQIDLTEFIDLNNGKIRYVPTKALVHITKDTGRLAEGMLQFPLASVTSLPDIDLLKSQRDQSDIDTGDIDRIKDQKLREKIKKERADIDIRTSVKGTIDQAKKNKTFKDIQEDLRKKLIKYISEYSANAQCKWSKSGQTSLKGLATYFTSENFYNRYKIYFEGFDIWLKDVEKSLTIKDKKGKTDYFEYTVNSGAKLMRYYAGASLDANFEPHKGRVNLKADGRADFSLFDAKADIQMDIPDKDGWKLSIKRSKKGKENDGLPVTNTAHDKRKEDGFNMVKTSLIDDINFEHNKSFLLRGEISSLVQLQALLKSTKHKGAKVKIIAHTDETGSKKYNWTLSQRRARAIFAFITRNPSEWEELYNDPNENWNLHTIKYILSGLKNPERVSAGVNNPHYVVGKINSDYKDQETKQSIKAYKRHKGLFPANANAEGDGGREFRLKLFYDYMLDNQKLELDHTIFMKRPVGWLGQFDPLITSGKKEWDNRRVEFWVYKPGDSTEKEVPLGHLLITLNLDCYAYLGANAVAALDIEVGVDASSLSVKGIEKDRGNFKYKLDEHYHEVEKKDLAKNSVDKKDGTTTQCATSGTSYTNSLEQNTGRHDNKGNEVYDGKYKIKSSSESKTTQCTSIQSTSLNDSQEITGGRSSAINKSQTRTSTTDITRRGKGPQGLKAKSETSIEVFAGARIGANGLAKLLWKSVEADAKFVDLARIGGGVEGSAGAGLTGEFHISYENNLFVIKVKAGVTWGLGAKGSFQFGVSPWNIGHFLVFVYTQLRKHDFGWLDIMSAKTFNQMNAYIFAGLILVKASGDIVSAGYELYQQAKEMAGELLDWWDTESLLLDQANKLITVIEASKIKENFFLKFATPEVRGRLLYVLTHKSLRQILSSANWSLVGSYEKREIAVVQVLKYIKTEHEFNETLEHISMGGTSNKTNSLTKRKTGLELINNLVDGKEQVQVDTLIKKLWVKKLTQARTKLKKDAGNPDKEKVEVSPMGEYLLGK